MVKLQVIEIEKEVEKVIKEKVKVKTGITLNLTPEEANLIFAILGRTNGDLGWKLWQELKIVCTSHNNDIFPGSPILDTMNYKCQEYLQKPLK